MKLIAKCKSCQKENVILHSSINDRAELSFNKGKEFLATCKNCLSKQKYHVNNFRAESSISFKLFGIIMVAAIVISILFLEYKLLNYRFIVIGGIFLVPSIAYGILKQQETVKLNSFNRYKVKE